MRFLLRVDHRRWWALTSRFPSNPVLWCLGLFDINLRLICLLKTDPIQKRVFRVSSPWVQVTAKQQQKLTQEKNMALMSQDNKLSPFVHFGQPGHLSQVCAGMQMKTMNGSKSSKTQILIINAQGRQTGKKKPT